MTAAFSLKRDVAQLVAHYVRDVGVACSSHVISTNMQNDSRAVPSQVPPGFVNIYVVNQKVRLKTISKRNAQRICKHFRSKYICNIEIDSYYLQS